MEAKYMAAQEEMKGKASLTKYRFPECCVPNRELSQVQALFGQREVWRTNKLKQKCMMRICVNPMMTNCKHCAWNV